MEILSAPAFVVSDWVPTYNWVVREILATGPTQNTFKHSAHWRNPILSEVVTVVMYDLTPS